MVLLSVLRWAAAVALLRPALAQAPAHLAHVLPPPTPPPAAGAAAGKFVRQHGRLHVAGTQLLEKIALRGVSLGWHSLWPRLYNEAAVQWLRQDFDCTVMRAAMGIEVGERNYKQDPAFSKTKVEAVVAGALQADCYVIIDWHSHNINLPEAKGFFAEMSKKYAKYPNIIYEVFNEPDQESWPEVKAYSEEIIKVIRANDSQNVILVGCPHWEQDLQLPAADPIKGQQN